MPEPAFTQTTLSPGHAMPAGIACCEVCASATPEQDSAAKSNTSRTVLRNESSRNASRLSTRMAAPDTKCPRWTTLASWAALLLCPGAGSVVTDTMPSCASGRHPTRHADLKPQAYRYDIEVSVDATLVVRAADWRREAVLHRGDRRAWTCLRESRAPRLSLWRPVSLVTTIGQFSWWCRMSQPILTVSCNKLWMIARRAVEWFLCQNVMSWL